LPLHAGRLGERAAGGHRVESKACAAARRRDDDRDVGEQRCARLRLHRGADVNAAADRARDRRPRGERPRMQEQRLPAGELAQFPQDGPDDGTPGAVRLDGDDAALVARYDPLVLSSGFHETIAPILEREGVAVEIRANRVDARPDGWRVLWADATPCAVCGDLCKRRALPNERPLVYVGDGYSDRCAALAADRVFAHRGLADYLDSVNAPYEPFETFDDIAAALT